MVAAHLPLNTIDESSVGRSIAFTTTGYEAIKQSFK
jgi:hypothetical protein